MAAQQIKTFSDIYSAVLEELKIQESDTTSLNRIKRDINSVYIDEVLPHDDWYWARINTDVVHEAYYNTGTASVAQDSVTITLSTGPTESQAGRLIQINGYAEIYEIKSHTAGSTTLKLKSKYTGTTNTAASFKIWDNGISLPVDLMDTYKVWHDHDSEPMQALGDKKLLELKLSNATREGRPRYFSVSDYQDPTGFSTITSLPALSTRASSGVVRTLTFATTVASIFTVGDLVEITDAGNEAYNGEFVIENVSTTTIKYIGLTSLTESATADLTLTIKSQDDRQDAESYRKLNVWPYLDSNDTTIHVEGIRKLKPLNNDNDEPAMPITDRMILVYGALVRAWTRLRNPEAAAMNAQLYERTLNRMSSKIKDSTDHARLSVSRLYLYGKRAKRTGNSWNS